MSNKLIAWIAADWGTSNLRVWAMDTTNTPLQTRQSADGMSQLQPDQFEPALLTLIGDWLSTDTTLPVLACGMVGARQGWVEAPYRQTPCTPIATVSQLAPVRDPRFTVQIQAGICQLDPADVIRGEETQVAGLLAEDPNFEGIVCLPGTHTKWVTIKDGKICNFRSVMTGEIFGLLATKSVLRHSLPSSDKPTDLDAFDSTIQSLLARNESGLSHLFSVRASQLLNDTEPDPLQARLSAYLIHDEISATRSIWPEQSVTIVGTHELANLYQRALVAHGVKTRKADVTELTLRGLIEFKRSILGY